MQSPEARDEHIVDALLDGGALLEDPIRMAGVLDELRARRPEPDDVLRRRIADVLVVPSAPPRRRSRRRPRRLVIAGGLVAACVVAGVLALDGSGSGNTPRGVDLQAAASPTDHGGFAGQAPAGATPAPATYGTAVTASPFTTLAPSTTRLQDYQASMRLRVRDARRLSQVTQRTISLTRGFDGYVTLSNVALRGARSGSAQVDVRIPVARVQDAIARFSSLGVITAQHVAVADLQAGYDAAERRAESLRHSLALIEIRLANPKVTPEQRVGLLAQRERAQHALAGARETSKGLADRGAYARIDLSFVTAARVAPAVAKKPGRFEHAVRRAGGLLETIGIGALFAVILGGPVLLVLGLVALGARTRRRRAERALLERA
jgi:Domain of unknown function (DUF4349)